MHKVRNFHEGRSTVGEWQGRGRGTAGERHGNGMVFVNRPLTDEGSKLSWLCNPRERGCWTAY
jgi:hypothetical protein